MPLRSRAPLPNDLVAALRHARAIEDAAVAGAGLIGFIGNEVVARYRIKVGRQIGSAALVADGLHARTDGYTSLAVLIGAGGVEKIVEIQLSESEKAALDKSAGAVKELVEASAKL